MPRIPVRAAIIPLALLALASCTKKEQSAPSAPATTTAAGPLAPPLPGTLYPTGVVLSGDRASLRYYLQNVDTVEGATAKITYAPATIVVDRNAAIRSLHGASWDGVTWRFDDIEPSVKRMQPGSVIVIWGLAIRKVTAVQHVGDEIVLTTTEAQLTDAVTDAQLKWDAPAHLLQGATALRVPKPEDSVQWRSSSIAPPNAASPFQFASFAPPLDSVEAPDTSPAAKYQQSYKLKIDKYSVAMAYGAPSDDQLNLYVQMAYAEDAEEPVALPGDLGPVLDKAGEFAKWAKEQQEKEEKEAKEGKQKLKQIRDETKMTSGPGPGLRQPIPKNSEEQQKQKGEEAAEEQYQKKYGRPSRSSTSGKPKLPEMPKVPSDWKGGVGQIWDGLLGRTAIKVTAVGTVTGFKSQGDIEVSGGRLQHAMLSNPSFHLSGDVYWVIRIDKAVFAGKALVQVPIVFRVPMIIAGLPMFLEIGASGLMQPAMTSKQATAKGGRHVDFTKSAQLTVTSSDVTGEQGEPEVTADKSEFERITGIGVSGLVIAVQFPRVGLGFGIIGSNITAYFDVVTSSGVSWTGTTGLIQCTHSLMVVNYNVGVSASFLGFPLGDKRKAGPSKQWDWDDPPGRKCG